MKWTSRRRIVALVAVLALASLGLTSAAVAGPGHRHPGKRIVRIVRVVEHRRVARGRYRKTFAPVVIRRAAEVSAVVLDPVTQQFMQVTFDRGQSTAVTSSTITLQQKQNNAVWRTQSFTVPSTATVTLDGRAVSLTQIPNGSWVRVESSGPVGGTQAVVRVSAYTGRGAPMPSTSSS